MEVCIAFEHSEFARLRESAMEEDVA
jgi:hypothetical protein